MSLAKLPHASSIFLLSLQVKHGQNAERGLHTGALATKTSNNENAIHTIFWDFWCWRTTQVAASLACCCPSLCKLHTKWLNRKPKKKKHNFYIACVCSQSNARSDWLIPGHYFSVIASGRLQGHKNKVKSLIINNLVISIVQFLRENRQPQLCRIVLAIAPSIPQGLVKSRKVIRNW